MTSPNVLFMLTGILSTLITAAVQIAVLVVVLTVVRRHRPDAVGVLAVSAGLDLGTTIVATIVSFVGVAIVQRSSGVDTVVLFQASTQLAWTLLHVVARVAFMVGLVRLARPEPGPLRDPGRYE